MPNPETIDDLRAHLFDTMKRLKDPEHPLDVKRAQAIVEVASVLVETAKVEIALAEATGAGGTGFIPDRLGDGRGRPGTAAPGLPAAGGTGLRRV